MTRRRFARRTLAWGVSSFLLLQLAVSAVLDRWQPVLRDPEFGYKLERLRGRQAESPEAPLILVLGSSRSLMGVRPDLLNADDGPLVFNFAMTGYGPLQELAIYHRLRRHGVRPSRLLLEVLPALLHQDGEILEENTFDPHCLEWADLAVMSSHLEMPLRTYWRWCRARLAGCYFYRDAILNRLAPRWLQLERRLSGWQGMDRWGWLPNDSKLSTEAQARAYEHARRDYSRRFQGFRITALADGALRELLTTCGRDGVQVALFTTPEGSAFRSLYPSGAEDLIQNYLVGLSRECGCSLTIGTMWCRDQDFWDGHHLVSEGATRFSRRLANEALRPLIAAGRPRESPSASENDVSSELADRDGETTPPRR